MTADIGSRVYGYSDEPCEAQRGDLVTRDLLGGRTTSTSTTATRFAKELDLDLRVPSGWERRLDLLSGETYLKKCHPDPIHDLNLPPPPPPPAFDLQLLLSSASSAPPPPPFDHQCTLEKVKSALERAGRRGTSRGSWRSTDGSPSSPSSSSSTSSSSKRRTEEAVDGSKDPSGSLTAAGCSKCLMYVLISSRDPRCPRCGSYVGAVPSAAAAATKKKQRREPMNMLDLNLNSAANGANF
ncbi:uncharacterized protein M6B38_277370 [Iris pallida]|uniref:GIR1-like zinc ribbon domain-containing protein n=1 Tax=Iris pallida TaxID=29817 RepID=A0AAX6I3P6_IRIPA|nr:uncharacterized protein M6B38_277370 [Iris pallida]